MPPKKEYTQQQIEAAYQLWLKKIEDDINCDLHFNWCECWSTMLNESFVITLN